LDAVFRKAVLDFDGVVADSRNHVEQAIGTDEAHRSSMDDCLTKMKPLGQNPARETSFDSEVKRRLAHNGRVAP